MELAVAKGFHGLHFISRFFLDTFGVILSMHKSAKGSVSTDSTATWFYHRGWL
jgi:hypothetical protein